MKKGGRKTKLTTLDKIVQFFWGTTPASGPKAKGRKAQCCSVGAKRSPDLGEMYKQALDAQVELNETPFLNPDFKKKYTEVYELYRKISSCAESALKTLTEELSEFVDLQDRFSAGDKNVLYETGRLMITMIDKRYKKGLIDGKDAVWLTLDLFGELVAARGRGDKRAQAALDKLRKSWCGWGEEKFAEEGYIKMSFRPLPVKNAAAKRIGRK